MTTALPGKIPAIFELARNDGKIDAFAGKRAFTRYAVGLSTQLTLNPNGPDAPWSVVTHNVSGGGVGLWSRERLSTGTAVYIRDLNDNREDTWLPGRVRHCSVGLRGYLLGIELDTPTLEPNELPITDEDADGTDGTDDASGAESLSPSKRQPAAEELRFIVCGCACAFIGYAISSEIGRNLPIPASFLVVAAIGILVGGLVGFLFGGLFSRNDAAHVRSLRQMIRDVSNGRPMRACETKAPTHHLASLEGSLVDLGNRLRLREEDERQQRERLEEHTQIKSNILAIVSHDMRTPLTSILLYAQMLLDELETLEIEDRKNFLEIIHSECTRLARLVDDLLEVQRLESQRVSWDIQAHDLADTVRSCVSVFEAMASNKGIELCVHCDGSLPPIEADADKLSQVLSNLLSNALKYTGENGTVEVSAERHGADFVLRVADSGPGIPRDQWDQIFDRFMQIRDPNTSDIAGVGLGLYIVKKIVEGHGGSAWVNSELGRGSEFVVSIPIKRPDPEARMNIQGLASRKVALCEPDPELAANIATILRNAGLEVRIAHCGSRLMTHLDTGDVDLVITDVLLPDVSGAELLERLMKFKRRKFRTIVHSYAGDAENLSAKGVDIFLKRPVSRQELLEAIQVAVKKRPNEGHNIVTVRRQDLNTERLHAYLAARGHTPMIAENLHEAAALVRDYAIDIVIVHESLLDEDWTQLELEPLGTNHDTRVVVLCDTLTKRHREAAESTRAEPFVFKRGQEHLFAESIMKGQPASPAEVDE